MRLLARDWKVSGLSQKNSSETEPPLHAPLLPPQGGAPGDHFFPGGLPPPSPDNLLRQDEEDVQGQCGQMRISRRLQKSTFSPSVN